MCADGRCRKRRILFSTMINPTLHRIGLRFADCERINELENESMMKFRLALALSAMIVAATPAIAQNLPRVGGGVHHPGGPAHPTHPPKVLHPPLPRVGGGIPHPGGPLSSWRPR